MNREVIANAIPIFSENDMVGAVVLIKDISQVIHLQKNFTKQRTFFMKCTERTLHITTSQILLETAFLYKM